MADYSAVLLAGALTTLAGDVSPNLSAYAGIYATAAHTAPFPAIAAAALVEQPFAPVGLTDLSAASVAGAGDRFLNRLHMVEYQNYEYPNLSVDTVNYVEVYNAGASTSLSAITVSSPSDVLVQHTGYYRQSGLVVGTAPDDPPTTYAPFESRRYKLTAVGLGAGMAFVLVTFDFTSQDFAITFDLTRNFTFAFAPNWEADVVESIEYLTDVIPAYAGGEQRRALRFWPRNKLEYRFLPATPREAAALESTLFARQSWKFFLPIWQDVTRTTGVTAAGATSIPVVTTNFTFSAGSQAIFWTSWETYEVVEIASVSTNSITTVNPVISTWASGTRIMPCRLARMQQQVEVSRPTSTILEVPITFEIDPADVPPVLTGATYPYTYRSNPVWTTRSNAEADTGLGHGVKGVSLDNKTGAQTIVRHSDYPLFVERPVGVLLKDRAAITEFRKFIGDRRGRQIAFWRPTWNRDLEPTAQLQSGTATMTVQRNYYTRYLAANAARKDIAVIKTDGTMVFARVLSAQESGGSDILTMTTNWGSTIALADIFMVCYLNFFRLDSDEIQLRWHSNSIVTSEVPLHLVAAPA